MMFEQVDRQKCKWETAELLRTAEVSPKSMTALFMALALALGLVSSLGGSGFVGIFISILATLLSTVLSAGFVLYCMAIRRGERTEYLTLFDGFSFVGRLILLDILTSLFVFFWTLLFIIPGFVAAYRYRFAKFNLYENPGIGVLEALEMSKRQTYGYKFQLFTLDLSYLGWTLTALLPVLLLNAAINYQLIMRIYTGGPPVPTDSFWGVPMIVWNLALGLWQLAVSLFYLPELTCVELSYFETAKNGLSNANPTPWDGWTPPDGLG